MQSTQLENRPRPRRDPRAVGPRKDCRGPGARAGGGGGAAGRTHVQRRPGCTAQAAVRRANASGEVGRGRGRRRSRPSCRADCVRGCMRRTCRRAGGGHKYAADPRPSWPASPAASWLSGAAHRLRRRRADARGPGSARARRGQNVRSPPPRLPRCASSFAVAVEYRWVGVLLSPRLERWLLTWPQNVPSFNGNVRLPREPPRTFSSSLASLPVFVSSRNCR